jgi:hypothetical protein
MASGDATWFMAVVNRIADILKTDGDTDPIGARRSKAIGILAQPARAQQLLRDHQNDEDDPPRPVEPQHDDGVAQRHDVHRGDATRDASAGDDLDSEDPGWDDPGWDDPGWDDPGWDDPGWEEAQRGDSRRDGSQLQPADEDGAPDDGAAEPSPEPATVNGADPAREHGTLDLTPQPGTAKASRPRVTLFYHLSDAAIQAGHGTVRPEHGTPETLAQLHTFLADTGCHITIRPVIDPANTAPIDGYEIPHRIRAAVRLIHPGEAFPYGTGTGPNLDLDHSTPYLPMNRGGPPGQTAVDKLGPLSRPVHRATTHGQWDRRQPHPGTFAWRSPTGWIFLVTNQGTLNLGPGSFAQAIWRAATAADQPDAAQDAS